MDTTDFERSLKQEGLSKNTIEAYLWTINYFDSSYGEYNEENLHAYKGY